MYACRKANGFVQGAWWPDFGPMSYDYSYQEKMHPTNTIFENVIDKQSRRKKEAEVVAERMTSESVAQQFRRPLPATEALFKSTIIQPYKSGGRSVAYGKGREGAWYEPPDQPSSPVAAAAKTLNAQIAGTMARGRETVLQRSASLPSASTSSLRLSGTGRRTLETSVSAFPASGGQQQQQLPSWVATHTLMSRQANAAGQSGAPKMQGDMTKLKSTTSPTAGRKSMRS